MPSPQGETTLLRRHCSRKRCKQRLHEKLSSERLLGMYSKYSGDLAIGNVMRRKKNNFRPALYRWTRMTKAHRLQLVQLFRGWIDDMHGGFLSLAGFQFHSNIQPLHYQ
jgi:hypothetical protein